MLIRDVLEQSGFRYGAERIHAQLKSAGVTVGLRRIKRIMRENGLRVAMKKARGLNTYRGAVGTVAPNLLERDFTAEAPNVKWVTDITEFRLRDGSRVYLSPVIDLFDGMPVAWTIGTRPDSKLANDMLEQACATLADGEYPLIHSDQGHHYQWSGWAAICEKHGLVRSMSTKGCSPDNAAAEGFFGRLKQEFWHGRPHVQALAVDGFISALDEYMHWYRDERIKTKFGTSIREHRQQLGLMA